MASNESLKFSKTIIEAPVKICYEKYKRYHSNDIEKVNKIITR